MPSFTVNGATLNGRAVLTVVLLATANLAASAVLTAQPTVTVRPGASLVLGMGQATGQATRIVRVVPGALVGVMGSGVLRAPAMRVAYPQIAATGSGRLQSRVAHTQAGQAALTGTVVSRASVRRDVLSSGTVLGTAQLVAIPASVLGAMEAAAAATLAGEATYTQPGGASGSATASVTGGALVYRQMLAAPRGTATLYVEPATVHCGAWTDLLSWDDTATWAEFDCYTRQPGYVNLVGAATTLLAPGIRSLLSEPALTGSAQASGAGATTQPGAALAAATGVMTPPLARLTTPLQASLAVSGALTVSALRVAVPQATPPATATLSGYPTQRHQGAYTSTGLIALAARGITTQHGRGILLPSGVVTATLQRRVLPLAATQATAAVTPRAWLRWHAQAQVSGGAVLAPLARKIRPGSTEACSELEQQTRPYQTTDAGDYLCTDDVGPCLTQDIYYGLPRATLTANAARVQLPSAQMTGTAA